MNSLVSSTQIAASIAALNLDPVIDLDVRVELNEANLVLVSKACEYWYRYCEHAHDNQLALMTTPGFFSISCVSLASKFSYSCGSLKNSGKEPEEEHTSLLPEAEWARPWIESVERLSGKKCTRARIMRMTPKTCLSYHSDPCDRRYHLVIKTNPGAMFIVEDKVYRMPVEGQTYSINTRKRHTAINASLVDDRYHLIVSTV